MLVPNGEATLRPAGLKLLTMLALLLSPAALDAQTVSDARQ
jgi:hypothetical protein